MKLRKGRYDEALLRNKACAFMARTKRWNRHAMKFAGWSLKDP